MKSIRKKMKEAKANLPVVINMLERETEGPSAKNSHFFNRMHGASSLQIKVSRC